MRCSLRVPRVTPKGRFIWGGGQFGGPEPPKALEIYPRVQQPSLGSLTSHWSHFQPQHWAGSPAGGAIPAQLGPPNIPVPCNVPVPAVVPVAAAVTADETEALKAEITKAVKQVQEAGETENTGLAPPIPPP